MHKNISQSQLDIPIFYGTLSNLIKIDLSFMNGEIVIYKGTKFRNWVKSFLTAEEFSRSYSSITRENDQNGIIEDRTAKRYAIIPVDLTKPFLEENWYHFYQLMLSIYPSDFCLVQVTHFENIENKLAMGYFTYYNFKSSGDDYFENFMYISRYEYNYINRYLQSFFYSSLKLNYLKYILSVFTNSFSEPNPIYQYLSLIICLEVIVEGNEQLTYKLKRNTALLCGKNVSTCEKIYTNIDQLYSLRSAIVHGNINPSYKHFKEYHSYLKVLVARLIRELVVHNIPTVSELNKKLTALGYGQNAQISSGYFPSKYPFVDNIRLSYKAIQKYKT